MSRLSTLFIFALIFLQMSCKRGPTEPEFKNPREYRWTIDTLAYPASMQTTMFSIWASSPNDVYVVGHNDIGYGTMYHFDGHVWKTVDPALGIGTLEQIIGFASNDVWAVGEHVVHNPTPPPTFLDSGLAIRFNGTKWQEVNLERQRALLSVWGSSPNDVWIGGLNAILFHHNGVSVERDSLPVLIPTDQETPYGIYSIAGNSRDNVYLLLYAPLPNGFSRNYLFKHQAAGWIVVDSTFGAFARIWMSPAGKLYSAGYGVYVREADRWTQILNSQFTSNAIYGLRDDDLFVVGGQESAGGTRGKVLHYNGADWFDFGDLSLNNVGYTGIWTDGREVFIVGETLLGYPQETIIVHGR
jgi:hypothetical protein